MHRDDKSKYLLYIEPSKEDKLKEPINDELTELIEMVMTKSQEGTSRYSDKEDKGSFSTRSMFKGSHRTDCGERSSNKDYLLENGMITNSLAPFYVKWYRYSIPESDMNKLEQLKQFYGENIQ
jgi:hypothetical protein